MKHWKRLAALVMVVGCMLLCVSCGTSSELRLGTGGTGGTYYAYGNALGQVLEDELDSTVEVKATAGSAANLRLLRDEFLQMAIVQSDTLLDAVNGTGAFDGEACTNIKAVAGLYTEACQIVVAADSDIYTVADLYGKRVSVGEEDSGVLRNAEQILLAAGLTTDMLDAQNLSFADSAAAMQAGELDAFFCTAGAPTTAVAELARQMDVRILSLDEEAMDSMMQLYPQYVKCTIPAGTYQGQDEDVQTLGVKAVLVASDNLSADTVENVLTALFDNADQIQYSTGVTTEKDLQFATENIGVAFHSGAQAYYSEHGVEVEEAAE